MDDTNGLGILTSRFIASSNSGKRAVSVYIRAVLGYCDTELLHCHAGYRAAALKVKGQQPLNEAQAA